jgi:glycosyltransferase involved in cell wall biosynthesis
MRVAVFTSKYPARVATFFERDMRGLLDNGMEIDVYCVVPLDRALARYRLALLDESVLPAERLHHIGFWHSLSRLHPWPFRRAGRFLRDASRICVAAARYGPVPLAKSAYVMPKAWAWATHAARPRYDHILAYWGNYSASCAYVFQRMTDSRTPLSIWLHAGTDLYFKPIFLRQKLLYADSIITCCAFNRDFIARTFGRHGATIAKKTHVVYHGVDLTELRYTPDGRAAHTVLAVGSFVPDKGFDYLLRAACRVIRSGVALDVELVGAGPEQRKLVALAERLGIADRVRFRGWLHFNDVQVAMRRATVLVHPSAGLGDGLPNVIREAMALGTPVIASDVAGISEALRGGACGMLVPTRDEGALAVAIERLLGDETLRRQLAAAARRHAEAEFDTCATGKRLAEHLRAVASARAPGAGLASALRGPAALAGELTLARGAQVTAEPGESGAWTVTGTRERAC